MICKICGEEFPEDEMVGDVCVSCASIEAYSFLKHVLSKCINQPKILVDGGPWYKPALNRLNIEWEHITFGLRNPIEQWFFLLKHRIKRFYRNWPYNTKIGTGAKVDNHGKKTSNYLQVDGITNSFQIFYLPNSLLDKQLQTIKKDIKQCLQQCQLSHIKQNILLECKRLQQTLKLIPLRCFPICLIFLKPKAFNLRIFQHILTFLEVNKRTIV
jgi:hypothetical protein